MTSEQELIARLNYLTSKHLDALNDASGLYAKVQNLTDQLESSNQKIKDLEATLRESNNPNTGLDKTS